MDPIASAFRISEQVVIAKVVKRRVKVPKDGAKGSLLSDVALDSIVTGLTDQERVFLKARCKGVC